MVSVSSEFKLSEFELHWGSQGVLHILGGIWGNLGALGRKERNACKDTIVFSIFHAQILSVKIVFDKN